MTLSNHERTAARVLTALFAVVAVMNATMWLAGARPLDVWRLLGSGTLGSAYGIGQTLAKATPLMLTGASVAFALRAGLFNIGAEGQLSAGILASAVVGAHLPTGTPAWLAMPIALASAAVAGASLGALVGFLRGRFGAHEVITTLMLNGLVAVVTNWLYGGVLRVGAQVQTRAVIDAARLVRGGAIVSALRGSEVNAALLLAVALPFALAWVLRRTSLGLRVRALGSNPIAARTLGVPITSTATITMAIAGAVAGMAGAHYVLGAKGYAEEGMGTGVGFAGIAVAMLAMGSASGIVVAALVLGVLAVGGLVVNALVPADMMAIAQAAALIAAASLGAALRPRTREAEA